MMWKTKPFRCLLTGVLLALGQAAATRPAAAQFPSHRIGMSSQLDLAAFGAASGNDCRGDVSPSGREYALMGLNNKVAVVEITNPSHGPSSPAAASSSVTSTADFSSFSVRAVPDST